MIYIVCRTHITRVFKHEIYNEMFQHARLGIRNQQIIDFTLVNPSLLNRHAYATMEDITTIKVMSMQQFLEKVAGGGCAMNARAMMYKPKRMKLDH